MPLVTVPGVAATSIDVQFQSPENTFRALDLIAALDNAAASGSLEVDNAPDSPPSGSAALAEYTLGDEGGVRGSGPDQGTVPAGYLGIVDAELSGVPATIVGADQPNETVIAAGGLDFSTAGGSGTLISAQGGNLVAAPPSGGGDWAVYFDGGDNTVYASSGNFFIEADTAADFGQNLLFLGTGDDTVVSYGQDTIAAGLGGSSLIELEHPNSVVYGGSGPSTVVDQSGHNTVAQGSGPETVFAAGSGGLYFGSAAPMTFVAGAGTSSTVIAGAGNAVLYGAPQESGAYFVGSGNFVLAGTGGDQSVIAPPGSGSTLLFAGAGDAINLYGDTPATLVAGAGTATLNGAGAAGPELYFAGQGSDCIVAAGGASTVVAGPGTDTLVGGAGPTTFEVDAAFAGGGHALIGKWNGSDQLLLFGYGAATAPGGLPAGAVLTAASGSTLLSLPDGTEITFVAASVDPSQIQSA